MAHRPLDHPRRRTMLAASTAIWPTPASPQSATPSCSATRGWPDLGVR